MNQISRKFGLLDFHTHSLHSDGVLLPSELVRRYAVAGFKAVAITDHADLSNIDFIINALMKVCRELNRYWDIVAIPGVELTHLPLQQFSPLTKYARGKGANVVVAHGETPAEPVIKGTNRAAIEAGVDILAHPGKIKKEDALLAAKKGICLEITTRRGHCKANRHVASVARLVSARLVINSDLHQPCDIPTRGLFKKVAREAHLNVAETLEAFANSEMLFKRIIRLTRK